MLCSLEDIEKITERLNASFGDSTVPPPTAVELRTALGALRKMVGKHALVDEIAHALRQRKHILSPQVSDSFSKLLALAKKNSPSKKKIAAIEYQPNHVPLDERWHNFLFSSALLLYGAYFLKTDGGYFRLKRIGEIHIHGVSAWIMVGAVVCAVIVLLSTIVDHYDRRNNEHRYHTVANWFRAMGWWLLGTGLGIAIVEKLARLKV